METISPEFIAILSVGVTLLSAGLILARLLFATLRQFRSDVDRQLGTMDKRVDETNERMEKEFDKANERMEKEFNKTNERMEKEFNKTNERMEKKFDEVEKHFSRQDDSLADIRERLGWIEGAIGKYLEPTRKTATAG